MAFEAPSTATESIKVADLNGKLLIIEPVEFKTGITTVHGDADAIEVNIVNLDDNTEHNNVLFFNVALKNSLKSKIGHKVLARVGQAAAKAGKSPAWILLDATGDAAAVAKANAYIGAVVPPVAAPVAAAGITPEVAALLAQLGAQQVK